MNTNTLQLIEKLATKLGTTADMLWGALVAQARLSAISHLVFVALVGTVLVLLIKPVKKWNETLKSSGDQGIPWVLWTIFLAAWLLCSWACSTTIISGLFNPEYWALKEVLNEI